MGVLNLERQPYHRQKITDALKRRGMIIDTSEEPWEIHGPHGPQMPFVVYCGWASFEDDPTDFILVTYSERYGVCEIESGNFSDWYQRDPERKIPVKTRRAVQV